MSLALERPEFSLPNSYVRSPGLLLRDKKPSLPSIEVHSKQKEIQDLLYEFRTFEKTSRQSYTDLSVIPNEKPTTFIEKKNPVNWSIKSRSDDQVRCPGRLKSSSESMSCLIHKSREMLQTLNIELIIHNSGNSQEIRSLLKTLIPEVCFFRTSFYESLNIKNIVIAKENEDIFDSLKDACFFLRDLDTPEKVVQKFHKIIFNQLMSTKGDQLTVWQLHEAGQINSLEDTFMTLMASSNTNGLMKSPAGKLREFLEILYPEAMTEEQFKLRSKAKKKMMLKVHFEVPAC